MDPQDPDIIVAEFGQRKQAERALRQVKQALDAVSAKLEEGALVSRLSEDEVEIVDLKDTAAADIIAHAADLTFYFALGVAKIVFNTAVSGLALLLQSSGRLAGLAGSVAFFPVKKLTRLFASTEQIARLGGKLEPGSTALVMQVDKAHVSTLRAALDTAGGRLLGQATTQALQDTAAELAAAIEEEEEAADAIPGDGDMSSDEPNTTFAARSAPAVAANGDGTRTTDVRLDGPSMAELEDRNVGQDLTEIEGIGPKIAAALTAAGIQSYADLAAVDSERLRTILANAGLGADPSTWPQQAQLAMRGHWSELRSLQERLQGGRAE